jgi:hypothetical protein
MIKLHLLLLALGVTLTFSQSLYAVSISPNVAANPVLKNTVFDLSREAVVLADQWFDTYGHISWEDERARLDNFAIALQNDPASIGYIIVYAGRRACVGEAKNRTLRAKKYLAQTRGIATSRIKLIDGGYREELTVILQPTPRHTPEIKAAPTVKPSEVQIIKNCKPKIPEPGKGR